MSILTKGKTMENEKCPCCEHKMKRGEKMYKVNGRWLCAECAMMSLLTDLPKEAILDYADIYEVRRVGE